ATGALTSWRQRTSGRCAAMSSTTCASRARMPFTFQVAILIAADYGRGGTLLLRRRPAREQVVDQVENVRDIGLPARVEVTRADGRGPTGEERVDQVEDVDHVDDTAAVDVARGAERLPHVDAVAAPLAARLIGDREPPARVRDGGRRLARAGEAVHAE